MGCVGVERWLWLLDRPYIALSVQRLHRKGNWKISARILRYFFHWHIVLVIEWCECIKYVHFFYFPHRHDDVSWRWVFIPVLDWVDVFKFNFSQLEEFCISHICHFSTLQSPISEVDMVIFLHRPLFLCIKVEDFVVSFSHMSRFLFTALKLWCKKVAMVMLKQHSLKMNGGWA